MRPGGRRRGRLAVWVAGVLVLALAALAAAALIPDSHATSSDAGLARRAVASGSAGASAPARETHVVDSSISAKRYGAQVAAMENGVDASGRLVSDLSPLPASAFARPVAEYRAYAERWAATLAREATPLTAALRSGDRTVARRRWQTAFADYLHLGAVYGLLPTALQQRLAGLPGLIGDPHFVGLHRIEMGLWSHEPVRSLARYGVALDRDRHAAAGAAADACGRSSQYPGPVATRDGRDPGGAA